MLIFERNNLTEMYLLKIGFLVFLFLVSSCKNQEENAPLDTNLEQAEQLFTNKEYRKAYYYSFKSF